MNILDYIIIAFILLLVIRGIFRGFIREISSLAGVILGIWLGNHFQPWITGILKEYLPLQQYLPLLAFIILFIAVLMACNIIGWLLTLFSKKPFMGGADRTSGAGLAALKGLILTYLIIVLLTFYLPGKTALIADSTLAPWIIKSYQKATYFISPDHYRNLKDRFLGETKKIGNAVSGKIKDLADDNE
ncbi:MAG: CvpA family protein [Deltaproteobacteria bacterium]|nr:CvpA family protein [Deltaproteobacteria bacterium]